MIKCRYNNDLLHEAEARAGKLGSLNNSIKQGKGNLVGYIGELGFFELFGAIMEDRKPELYNYDVLNIDLNKVEIKSKYNGTDSVKPDYEGSVANFNATQDYNHLAFMRVNTNTKTIWFCGYVSKEEFALKSHAVDQGHYDRSNDWTSSADCRSIYYRDCHQTLEVRLLPEGMSRVYDIEVV